MTKTPFLGLLALQSGVWLVACASAPTGAPAATPPAVIYPAGPRPPQAVQAAPPTQAPELDWAVIDSAGRTALPRMNEALARKVLEPWGVALTVGGIALGMSRDDVIATCSLSGEGTIIEQLGGVPMAVGARAREQAAMGNMTHAALSALDDRPPYLDRIECGTLGDSVAAVFAGPPNQQRVVEVHRFLNERSRKGAVGQFDDMAAKLASTFGEPALRATQKEPQGLAHWLGWIFRQSPDQIACLVKAEAESGGALLAPAIPSGGWCAAHVSARLDVAADGVHWLNIEMLNPDVVAYTRQKFLASFGVPNLPVGADYQQFANNAHLAGLETRDEAAWRGFAEIIEKAARSAAVDDGGRTSQTFARCRACVSQCTYSSSSAQSICRGGCTCY